MGRRFSRMLAAGLACAWVGARAEEAAPPCHGPGAQPAAADAAAPAAPPARVEVPDVELLDQDGNPVRLRQALAGDRVVVMDFIFTTCTTVCPVLSAIMSRIQEQLGDRMGREVTLVSVTVDPARDTPERLKAYARKHRARDGWTWLTGSPSDVERVLRGMGAYTASFTDHPPMILVGDGRTGTWTRFNGFPSQARILAQVDLVRAAHQEPKPLAARKE